MGGGGGGVRSVVLKSDGRTGRAAVIPAPVGHSTLSLQAAANMEIVRKRKKTVTNASNRRRVIAGRIEAKMAAVEVKIPFLK